MRLNKELDYETIYNGRGIEIGKMLVDYFDEDMKLVKKEAILPDRPDRNNKVGLRLIFKLQDGIEIVFTINESMGFALNNVGSKKKRIKVMDYMTFAKIKQLGFSFSDEIVYEKLFMLKYVIEAVRNKDEIIRFDVEKQI